MTKKMNPEIKEKWVAALRSGDYRQGQNYLRQNRGGQDFYCCLGVLTDLAMKDGVPLAVDVPHPEATDRVVLFDDGDGSYSSFTPKEVVEWAGLDADDPVVERAPEGPTTLAILNDTGHSFAQIADLIERDL